MFCCNSIILADEVCCPNERNFPADAEWENSKDVYRTPGQSLHLPKWVEEVGCKSPSKTLNSCILWVPLKDVHRYLVSILYNNNCYL